MSVRPSRFGHVMFTVIAAGAAATAGLLAQAPPVGAPPPAPAEQAPAPGAQPPAAPDQGRGGMPGGFGGGRGRAMSEPDFSPKPPVLPLRPEEQVKKFWLPPGFKMELVLADPDIEESAQIAFDGNGRLFVLEIRGYMQDADGGGTLAPVGRISVHDDRDNDGVYEVAPHVRRQPGVPTHGAAVRPERDSYQGVERRRGLEVHRHEQRQRRRQERAVHDRHGPPGQRRAPGKPLHVGHGQLDLQHLQRVSCAVDARRRAAGADRRESGAVGRDAGQLRQAVVPVRRQRHAGIFPVPRRVRQLRRAGSVRARPQHHVGRARADCRHAGRHELGADARRVARPRDRRGRQRHLPRRPAAQGHGRRLLLRRDRGPHRAAAPAR